jgi:RNA polymerase sigma factor (sigma-70 family)
MRDGERHVRVEALPRRLLSLEPEAFQDFARTFGGAFRRHFLDRGLEPFEAEDLALCLVTDIPLKVISGQFKEREDSNFGAWVFALMRNAVKDWWRKRARVPDVVPIRDDEAGPDDESAPSENVQVILAVREAVEALPEQARQIVELRDLGEERDYAEIAEILGITSGAARVRHSRALVQLAGVLEQDPRMKNILERAQSTKS